MYVPIQDYGMCLFRRINIRVSINTSLKIKNYTIEIFDISLIHAFKYLSLLVDDI